MSDLTGLQQSEAARGRSLAEWRASRLQDLVLPVSGLSVKVRDMTLTDLALSGKLPNTLIDLVVDAENQGETELDLKSIFKDQVPEFAQLLDTVVELCLVEPKIGPEPDDDHITLDEMLADDKMAIFNWANREADQIQPFRPGAVESDQDPSSE